MKDFIPSAHAGEETGVLAGRVRPKSTPDHVYSSRVSRYCTEVFDYCWKLESAGQSINFLLGDNSVGKGFGLLGALFSTQNVVPDTNALCGLGIVQFSILHGVPMRHSACEQREGNDGWFDRIYPDSECLGVPESFYLKQLYELIDMGLIEKKESLYRVSPFFNRNLRKTRPWLAYRGLYHIAGDFCIEGLHRIPLEIMDYCGLSEIEKIAIGAIDPLKVNESLNPEFGHIYLVSAEGSGRYKIGLTTGSVESRIRSFKTGSAFPISLEYSFRTFDVAATEKALHKLFDSQRVKGEWFYLSEEDRMKIRAIGHREEWRIYWRIEVDNFLKKQKESEEGRAAQ